MTAQSDAETRILLDALVTYADSCTLPELTPSCPYFALKDGTPSCEEECRTLIETRGGGTRKIGERDVGGLILRGREIPITIVSGSSVFDAAQSFLKERDAALAQQSTASLLLLLRSAIAGEILATPRTSTHSPLDIWGELSKRGIDMDRLSAGGLTRAISGSIAIRIILDRVAEGDQPLRGDSRVRSEWTDVLDVAFEAYQRRKGDRFRDDLDEAVNSLERIFEAMSVADPPEDFLAAHPEVEYCLSRDFLDRVSTWLMHQIADDLTSALMGTAPPPEMFAAMDPVRSLDEVGMWIWERFTQTSFDHWTQSSLLLEWRWAQFSESNGCPQTVLNERRIEATEVGERALTIASGARGRRRPRAGLAADMFVEAATRHLIDGRWKEATYIFAGLVELRPGDPEAWNNYGFCELAGSPENALALLQRADQLTRLPRMLNLANQVLALHLLGRNPEAQLLGGRALVDGTRSSESVYVWAHPADDGELELVDGETPEHYLRELMAHIAAGQCDFSSAS